MTTKSSLTGFDLDRISAKLKSFRVTVNDYEMVTPTLAKVVINMTGMPESPLEIRAAVANIFKQEATVVENSFRWANRNGDLKSAIGYVRANTEVREFDEKTDGGKYRVMSSNLLMDNEDRQLWEVREGAGTKYLARQGNEDLSTLVHLAHHRVAASSRLIECASAAPSAKNFLAFIDRATEEVRYGFSVESATDEGKLTVVVADSEEAQVVEEADVIDVFELDKQDEAKLSATAAADGLSKEAMVEYYKKAYPYSPEYVQEIIKMIEQHAFA